MKAARFYFSLRSPYSWLACRDLVSAYADVADVIEWRPFWEPDEESRAALTDSGGSFPYVDMSRAKALYILQDVRRLAQRRGLAIAWPVDRAPHWEVAHLAYLAAERAGRGRAFIDAVYRARWEEGRDISDPATMAAVATELQLSPEDLSTAVSDPQLRADGIVALRRIDRDGVFGVPFFVHGREKFWGLDRLPDFAAAVRADRRADAESAQLVTATGPASTDDQVPVIVGPGGDQGHAGGCG
ncbi:2-hydroxychromene-2-carboxylate isomerase [Micromonospora sp. DT228]|uniref:2-hydroxychromene-2-carboxylate isomerase n=1 Tax=Micromonospora sp. DT228 TaxID=3393443 RepID=UPI003CEE0C17